MSQLLRSLLTPFLTSILLGCSQPDKREYIPENDGGSSAPGHAYAGDAMLFRKPMNLRRDWRPVEFYFKHCSQIDEKPYYSKTAYECSQP